MSLNTKQKETNPPLKSVITYVKKFYVYSADWRKKVEVDQQQSFDDTVFEAATRAVEWALKTGKAIGILVHLQDFNNTESDFVVVSYKVLANAGYHSLAEEQRKSVKEEFGVDLAEEPLGKLISKLQKASLRKAYCISKYFEIQIENRVSKVPIMCFQLGLFESKEEAQLKCKELNNANSAKEKLFVVKKLTYNESP